MFKRYKKFRPGDTLPPSLISAPIQSTTAQMSFPTSTPPPRTPSVTKLPVRTATLRKSRRPRPNSTSPAKPGYMARPNAPTPAGSPKKNATKGHSKFSVWSNGSRTSISHQAGMSNESKTAGRTWDPAVSGSCEPLGLASASHGRFSWNSHLGSLALPPPMSDTFSAMAAEITALKAENKVLSREVAAERKFSAMVVEVLKGFHELVGRVNPAPGDLGSEYYKDLRDECGNPLVPLEFLSEGLVLHGLDSEWEDQNEVLEDSGSREKGCLGRDDPMATIRPSQVRRRGLNDNL